MSFNIGLSGLYAANKQLDVTGNNIANVATTGFKSSRAEFGDIYAASRLGTGNKTIGTGVNLAAVSQQFTQGEVNGSGGVLDMGIANEKGYVYYPNVNVVEEMADMISASRSFQTNAEMMNTAKAMMQKVLTLGQ